MNFKPILLILLVPVILLYTAGTLAAVELYVKSSIEAKGKYLSMEDIVVPSNAVGINLRGIEKIPHLSDKPALLAAAEVRKSFMPFLPGSFDPDNITIVGGYTGFLPDSVPVEEKPLYRAIFEQLKEKAKYPVTRIEVSIEEVDRYGYGINIDKDNKNVFRVVLSDIAGTVYVRAEVTAFAVCAVAGHILRWGDPLTRSSVEFQEVRVPMGKLDSLIVESFPINRYELRGSKDAGDILFSSDIEKISMVRAGKPITIHYAKDGIHLMLQGKAYNSGGFAETVTVKPENSTKKMEAEVIGYSEVRLEGR
jgi:flagella basal body P-ring formation protein FlgA